MITQWLVQLGLSIVGWIGTLFQPFDLPAWLTDSSSGLYGFLNSAAGLGAWMPLAALSVVVGFLATAWLSMFAIKLILRVWSMLPVVGGGGG